MTTRRSFMRHASAGIAVGLVAPSLLNNQMYAKTVGANDKIRLVVCKV